MSQSLATTAAIDDAVAGLTVDEKILLLEGVDSWSTNEIPRLGIRSLFLTDGPHGVRKVRADTGAFGLADTVQATAFPTSATVANSWSAQNAEAMGAAIARECVARGVDVLLAPGVNIKRNPLCGRNFEYYSEDPLVSGVLGAAFVSGVQSEGVGTSLKHFAANSNEDYRFVGDSLVDERALREIYLRAFERVVTQSRPWTVMAAYNALNGTSCSENRELLTGILREEWGFDGVVLTDWGATRDRVAGINAGCELDMPGQVPHNRQRLHDALRDGALHEATLDEAVRRMLTLVDRCQGSQRAEGAEDADAHAALAQRIAEEGAVLLANDGTLPLDPNAPGLLVVGEMFERMRFQGAGSSLINPPSVVTPQHAFDRRGIDYRYARGYRSMDPGPDAELARSAVEAARQAQTVLFFGGLSDLEESEGFDRTSMALDAGQSSLLEQLIATGTPVVLVLFAGAPVELPFADRLAAVLDLYLPGMQGGEATAALLFGEKTPSGKLAESWPLSANDASSAADFDLDYAARYYESIYVGYRYYDKAGTPLRFPFGHGLSYTTFDYRDLRMRVEAGAVEVTVTIMNSGDRSGAEVVQLYVRNNRGQVFKADKELRAFARTELAAGASADIRMSFDLDDLAHWDVGTGGWVLENGEYEVLVAASAADVRLSAPLVVANGSESRSPYSADVDRAYAVPPATIPAEFATLLGRPLPAPRRSRRLTLETRLVDARRSLTGAVMYSTVVGRVRRAYRTAQRLPDSLERDARVKNTHFLVRMMPFNSLRSMVMSSAGVLPYHVAAGLSEFAAGHPIRAVRTLRRGR